MAEEVDRRGFMRLWRRSSSDDTAEAEAERELSPEEQQLAEFTARLLADVSSEDEEALAEGPLFTRAKDTAYMRVTAGHIVYSTVIGSSALIKTSDVTAFDTEPPVEVEGKPRSVIALLRAHHPADPPHVTRSYSLVFPADSPLMGAIRTAANIPEPEAEAEEAGEPQEPGAGESEEPEAEPGEADGQ